MKNTEKNLKIPIIGVTKESEAYEQDVIKYLKCELAKQDPGIELINISIYKNNLDDLCDVLYDKISIIEESNRKVIILTDAKTGSNEQYEALVRRIYDCRIRPFVLVTHFECAKYDVLEVSMRPAALLEYYDSYINIYHHIYDSAIFDFHTKNFYDVIVKEGQNQYETYWNNSYTPYGIDYFVRELTAYYNEDFW